ncbi:MAG: recombinase family protein [Deltaproteobacteria bacterium]|nr:recombinase family protein [Deltaproteobacteria bacterium]
MTEKIRYFIYARKSTDETGRQVASIGDQLNELRRLAERDGLEVIGEITESQSAKQPGRKEFNQMVQAIRAGKAQGIITWKIDRLARNPVDEGTIKWLQQEGKLRHIRTSDRDYYQGDNVLMIGVDFGVANQFILDLKANVMRGMRSKVQRGWFPAFAPLGYLNRQIRKGEHDIIPDPERFELVKQLWHDVIYHHFPLSRVYDKAIKEMHLRSKKGKILSMSQFYDMFESPFYYGYFYWNGQLYKGNHQPMITKREFDIAQEILHTRHHPRKKKHSIAFTGLLKCGACGSMLTGEHKVKRVRGGEDHHYFYYRCTRSQNKQCTQRPVNEKEIDKQVLALLEQISLPIGVREAILEVLGKDAEDQGLFVKQALQARQKEYDKCVLSLSNLLRMQVRGEVSEEEAGRLRKELNEEKIRLEEQLKDTSLQMDSWMDKIDVLLAFAELASPTYVKADADLKKQILMSLGQNLTVLDGKVMMDKNLALFGLSSFSMGLAKEKRPIEPAKLLENQALTKKIRKWSG